ncbi:hypothetical protein E0K89_015595 [Aquicoccus sp. SCR17]|nr:hypothetical protein [Carideicomes alvinocaridis]
MIEVQEFSVVDETGNVLDVRCSQTEGEVAFLLAGERPLDRIGQDYFLTRDTGSLLRRR